MKTEADEAETVQRNPESLAAYKRENEDLRTELRAFKEANELLNSQSMNDHLELLRMDDERREMLSLLKDVRPFVEDMVGLASGARSVLLGIDEFIEKLSKGEK